MELKPGKHLLPEEAEMSSERQRKALEGKLERVAAMRQIQGISKQVYHLTKKRATLDDFKLPEGCNVRPVRQGEVRSIDVSDVSGTHVFIKDKGTGDKVRVLPPLLEDVKLLLLQYDQGSIGGAAAACLEFRQGRMVTVKFDKIHRIIRDMKLAGQAVPIFVKSKLWSAYIFSLNKRPFGSGAHGTAKERMLDVFCETVTVNTPVFVKYLPLLAKEWLGRDRTDSGSDSE